MKAKDLFKKKKSPELEQQEHNREANRQLFYQELQGMEANAASYFQSFRLRPDGKPRYWLMPGEGIEELTDDKIEAVLKYLAWFKNKIMQDDVVYD